jgi:hypothetical protein
VRKCEAKHSRKLLHLDVFDLRLAKMLKKKNTITIIKLATPRTNPVSKYPDMILSINPALITASKIAKNPTIIPKSDASLFGSPPNSSISFVTAIPTKTLDKASGPTLSCRDAPRIE